MRVPALAIGFIIVLVSNRGASAQAPMPPCFVGSESAMAELTSAGEKTFNFSKYIRLCDGQDNTSGQIKDAVALLVLDQKKGGVDGKPATWERVYVELNYTFYNGVGTQNIRGKPPGSQALILTVQDKNHNDLLPNPVLLEETPRGRCHYGHFFAYKTSRDLPGIFQQIEFVTMSIPRVTGDQDRC